MRISLIGMAGSGKSYWSKKLAHHGFRRFCCDDMIAEKLDPALIRPDGDTMGMGKWMGLPYEHHYKLRESQYLAYERAVLTDIIDYLKSHENASDKNLVVDTTGSAIYAGEEILQGLCRYTIVVYLLTPPEIQGDLFRAYIKKPHPMVWGDAFHKRQGETDQEALVRCYPHLLADRSRLYARYAAVELDYYQRTNKDFTVTDFLNIVQEKVESVDT